MSIHGYNPTIANYEYCRDYKDVNPNAEEQMARAWQRQEPPTPCGFGGGGGDDFSVTSAGGGNGAGRRHPGDDGDTGGVNAAPHIIPFAFAPFSRASAGAVPGMLPGMLPPPATDEPAPRLRAVLVDDRGDYVDAAAIKENLTRHGRRLEEERGAAIAAVLGAEALNRVLQTAPDLATIERQLVAAEPDAAVGHALDLVASHADAAKAPDRWRLEVPLANMIAGVNAAVEAAHTADVERQHELEATVKKAAAAARVERGRKLTAAANDAKRTVKKQEQKATGVLTCLRDRRTTVNGKIKQAVAAKATATAKLSPKKLVGQSVLVDRAALSAAGGGVGWAAAHIKSTRKGGMLGTRTFELVFTDSGAGIGDNFARKKAFTIMDQELKDLLAEVDQIKAEERTVAADLDQARHGAETEEALKMLEASESCTAAQVNSGALLRDAKAAAPATASQTRREIQDQLFRAAQRTLGELGAYRVELSEARPGFPVLLAEAGCDLSDAVTETLRAAAAAAVEAAAGRGGGGPVPWPMTLSYDKAAEKVWPPPVFHIRLPDCPNVQPDDLTTVFRELARGVYVFGAAPFLSLENSSSTNTMHLVLHPAFRGTLVGKICLDADKALKSVMGHGLFTNHKKEREFYRKFCQPAIHRPDRAGGFGPAGFWLPPGLQDELEGAGGLLSEKFGFHWTDDLVRRGGATDGVDAAEKYKEEQAKIKREGKMPYEEESTSTFGRGKSGAVIYGLLDGVRADGNVLSASTGIKPQFHYCEGDYFVLGSEVARKKGETATEHAERVIQMMPSGGADQQRAMRLLRCEQEGERLFREQLPTIIKGAAEVPGSDIHPDTLELLQVITCFSSLLMTLRQQAPSLAPKLPGGWWRRQEPPLFNGRPVQTPLELPLAPGKYGEHHIALVGGCGMETGLPETLFKAKRMGVVSSPPPGSFPMELTQMNRALASELSTAQVAERDENLLFDEEVKAHGLWGCYKRDFPWAKDPAARNTDERPEPAACADMLARVFPSGYSSRFSMDVRDVIEHKLQWPAVRELFNAKFPDFPRAKIDRILFHDPETGVTHKNPGAVCKYPSGTIYDGDWLCGKWDGHGRVVYSVGHIYEGEFKDGMIHGKGRYSWPGSKALRGRKLEELVRTNQLDNAHGEAEYHGLQRIFVEMGYPIGLARQALKIKGFKLKAAVEALVKANAPTQRATEPEHDDWFEGDFAHGMRVRGQYKVGSPREGLDFDSDSGTAYKGGRDDQGRPHGHGEKWVNGGDQGLSGVFRGNFKHGKRTHGEFIWHSGHHYEGQWQDEERTGKGRYTWSDGSTYVGDFKDGNFHGKGKLTYRNKEGTICGYSGEYSGNFRNDKWHGEGTYRSADGKTFCGEWRNGASVGGYINSNCGACKRKWD